jgi:hypothetical protein
MKNDDRASQSTLRKLLPTLLMLAACGSAKAPGATTGGAAGAGAAAGTSGAAGATGGDAGGAGATGAGGASGASGTAGGQATGGAGSTGTAGTPADGGAPEGGAGTSPQPTDGPLNPEGGTVLPPYDGGIVNVINSTNWDETTIHPFDKRRMILRDEGDPHLLLVDFGRTPSPLVWRTVTGGPWTRGIQLIGNNQVLGGQNDGYEIYDLTTGQITKRVTGFPSTQCAYRMANGETMLTQSVPVAPSATGSITLSFLDKTDRISHAIRYPGFSYVRMVRPTRNKTFLVPSDTTLFESDASGKILWMTTGTGWGHIWEPLLMSDGNVLLGTFFGASLDVVDRDTHKVTKRYGTKTMPNAAMFHPNAFADFQILPNGNLITTNWQGLGGGNGTEGIQIIEFDPAGAVVWFWKQDPTFVSTLQGVLVIDGMDPKFLHAQEISADSTWQPVIPTP